ncbi:MAG: hypothetical protein ACJAVK_003745, partial [Akkermansiaceae bacterium]
AQHPSHNQHIFTTTPEWERKSIFHQSNHRHERNMRPSFPQLQRSSAFIIDGAT